MDIKTQIEKLNERRNELIARLDKAHRSMEQLAAFPPAQLPFIAEIQKARAELDALENELAALTRPPQR